MAWSKLCSIYNQSSLCSFPGWLLVLKPNFPYIQGLRKRNPMQSFLLLFMNSYSVDFNLAKCLSLCKVSLKQTGLFTCLKCSPLLDQGGSSLLVSLPELYTFCSNIYQGTWVSVKYRNLSVQFYFFLRDCHTLLSFRAVLCTDLQSTRLSLPVHHEMVGAWRGVRQIISELISMQKKFSIRTQ